MSKREKSLTKMHSYMRKRIYVCMPDATFVCNFFFIYPNDIIVLSLIG